MLGKPTQMSPIRAADPPLLTLQRLLGHASPSTTMVYLRYVDESDELIQRAFESWSDNERDYASYVLAQIEAQRP